MVNIEMNESRISLIGLIIVILAYIFSAVYIFSELRTEISNLKAETIRLNTTIDKLDDKLDSAEKEIWYLTGNQGPWLKR